MRRDVHGHADDVAVGVQLGEIEQRSPQHVLGERADQAGLLGHGDELVGTHRTEPFVRPSRQCLDTGHRPCRDLDLRLIMHLDVAVDDRRAELAGNNEPSRAETVSLSVVHLVTGSRLLRLVHGDIGSPQQQLGIRAVIGSHREADTSADLEREALGLEGTVGERYTKLLCTIERSDHAITRPQEQSELVAPEARHDLI